MKPVKPMLSVKETIDQYVTLLEIHPWPWRIEEHPKPHVIAADGRVVAKCRTMTLARSVVELAQAIRQKSQVTA